MDGVYVYRNPVILIAVFLFLLGFLCILMGLMAELIIHYHESQAKPIYRVREVQNIARPVAAVAPSLCAVSASRRLGGPGSTATCSSDDRDAPHRGPDEEAYFLLRLTARWAEAASARRPSIIDVEEGQPLANEDESVWTMLNGEIYNFAELRRPGVAGHAFSTNGDAETLVHLYEESGLDCTERLNGMFAFAVWDTRRRRLLPARPAGQEASVLRRARRRAALRLELKALLQHPACPRELDRPALEHYLAFEYVPSPTRSSPGSASRPWPPPRLGAGKDVRRAVLGPPVRRAMIDRKMRSSRSSRSACARPFASASSATCRWAPSSAAASTRLHRSSPSCATCCRPSRCRRSRSASPSELRRVRARAAAALPDAASRGDLHLSVLLDVLPEVTAGLDEPFADPSVLPTFLLPLRTGRR